MSSLDGDNLSGQAYWRSLDELAETPAFREFVEKEFPHYAPELFAGPTRRRFLKLMGASMALAGLTGCRWPKENIVPYAKRPNGRTPGAPVQYATAMEIAGCAQGLLVTSYDGRPIKVEGNDRHPTNAGATDVFAQASVLDLYDPDRVQHVLRRDQRGVSNRTWAEFREFARPHFAALAQQRGRGLCVLSEASSSPTLAAVRREWQARFPESQWVEWESVSSDNEREGTRLAFGAPLRPHLRLEKADVVVSLDSDFLMRHPDAIRHAREFSRRRRPDVHNGFDMSRLYVFESGLSVTGARADARLALRPSEVAGVLDDLAREIEAPGTLAYGQDKGDARPRTLAAAARDLRSSRGRCVLIAGPQQPPEVHAVVHRLNLELGAVGETIVCTAEPQDVPSGANAVKALTERMRAGDVDTLLILGGNPAYDAPADLEFAALLAAVPTTVHLTLFENETSRLSSWTAPRAHYLESWGDARAYDGTVSVAQPLIEPLYGGKTSAELLTLVTREDDVGGYELTRRAFAEYTKTDPSSFENAWRHALNDGVVAGTAYPLVEKAALRNGTVAAGVSPAENADGDPATRNGPKERRQWATERDAGRYTENATPAPDRFELCFVADYSVYDGRFANNGWLQETPDPLTKLTWDNAALIAPVDARRLNVTRGDMLRIEVGARSLDVPAFVLPGQPAGVIALPLGYGTTQGRVSEGAGFNAYALRTSEAPSVVAGARVTRAAGRYALATTQDHQAMDTEVGRQTTQQRIGQLAREASRDELMRHPDFAAHRVHVPKALPLWREHDLEGSGHNQWAMSVDLSTCIGCNACVVACQAENNIPIVGKEEVELGREMQWIRIDRYFKGDPDDIEGVVHQPVTCHHCENAPCEQVCPVAATVHDEEGLNVMVYNRCVGTRYCSNNCPYKVRRFNWFYNHRGPKNPRSKDPTQRELNDVEKMQFNPEVTVRSRGVMEKCTFCVQRISQVKIAQRNNGRDVEDGMITPACAQVCPAQAIVFGDLTDPDSRVSKLHAHERSYEMLKELNVKARLKYMARITNPPGKRAHGIEE